MVDVPPGARVEVRRGALPVLLARLPTGVADSRRATPFAMGASFTDRLVAKFGLPVAGWRGRGRARQDAAARTGDDRIGDEEPAGDA